MSKSNGKTTRSTSSTTAMSSMNTPADEEKVVMEQTLVKIEEVFVYQIPPMRSVDGHRAEDWNLAKPLATCQLHVVRRDNSLVINIMADRPKPGAPAGATETYLFAQSNIHVDFSKSGRKMEHWVVSAIDSSRYFAIRISDPKTGREAFIGVGFRERTDATNFKMSLQDYENSLKREEKALALQKKFEQSAATCGGGAGSVVVGGGGGAGGGKGDGGKDGNGEGQSELPAMVESKLSLKEGEKIHINIKAGGSGCSKRTNSSRRLRGSGTGLTGLKLPPPPPPGASSASATSSDTPDSSDDSDGKGSATPAGATAETSEIADDEWGDFEG